MNKEVALLSKSVTNISKISPTSLSCYWPPSPLSWKARHLTVVDSRSFLVSSTPRKYHSLRLIRPNEHVSSVREEWCAVLTEYSVLVLDILLVKTAPHSSETDRMGESIDSVRYP